MGTLTASLEPDTRPGCHLAGGELDTIVAADADGAITDARISGHAGRRGVAARHLGVTAAALLLALCGVGQQGLDVAHEGQVRVASVAGGSDDEVDIEDLIVAAVRLGGQGSDPQTHGFGRRRFKANDVGRGADPVRPATLVASKLTQLVVHSFVQLLDQPQAHHAVVGRACIVN